MRLKSPARIRDCIHYWTEDMKEQTSEDFKKGVAIGLISGIMGANGYSYDRIAAELRLYCMEKHIPFQDFIKSMEVKDE